MSPVITPYQAACQEAIVNLVTGIQQQEFNVPVTLADQPDLQDIPAFYQTRSGNFWQALNDREEVVGTIGLLDVGQQTGVIRKMFVHQAYRGGASGHVAVRLLQELEQWALAHQMETLYLGTVGILERAISFYRKHGYERIEEGELPACFPRMAVDNQFFRKELGRKAA